MVLRLVVNGNSFTLWEFRSRQSHNSLIWDINPFNICFYEFKTVYVGTAIVQKLPTGQVLAKSAERTVSV